MKTTKQRAEVLLGLRKQINVIASSETIKLNKRRADYFNGWELHIPQPIEERPF